MPLSPFHSASNSLLALQHLPGGTQDTSRLPVARKSGKSHF
jgi:hypothetical protein